MLKSFLKFKRQPQLLLKHTQYFCSANSPQNRNKSLLEILNENLPEEFYTDSKLPEIILNELTKEFSRPKLPRISKFELYNFLQENSTLLSPYMSMLNHFIVDESQIKDEYDDPNQIKDKIIEEEGDPNITTTNNELSDDKLIELLNNKYLIEYKNNSEILYNVAMNFYDISNINKSYRELIYKNNRLASIFLSLACQLNHIDSQLQLGKQYMLGYGVNKNHKDSVYYFVRSGAQGCVESRAFLGSMYLKGYGIKKNEEKAYLLLNEASRLGNPQGQRYLAELYEIGGEYIKQDFHLALRLAEKACGQGAYKLKQQKIENKKIHNPQFVIESATIAGRMYCYINKFKEAIPFFEQASELGDMNAQCNLGHILHIGTKDVNKDLYLSVIWLLKSANQGNKRAHRELGMIYVYTDDNEWPGIYDIKEGIMWLDAASKGGYIDCYFRLGEIFASGNNKYEGITQNFKAAKKMFEMCREESTRSKNEKDKLPAKVWETILKDPLQSSNLIKTYEDIIGGKWRGSIGDLNPDKLRKMTGVEHDDLAFSNV